MAARRWDVWENLPSREIRPGVSDAVLRKQKVEVVAASDYDALEADMLKACRYLEVFVGASNPKLLAGHMDAALKLIKIYSNGR
jgi:hypothetical protein